jgi:plastocyanin
VDAVTRKLAASYAVGQIAIPAKALGEIGAGAEARITAVDTVKNTLTLEADGKTEVIDARKQSKGLMIYEERKTQLSEGEKITWLKTDNSAQGKHNKIKNGLTGTIERINGDQLTVKTQLGHTVQIQGQDAYITNAQAITGHKSQGATEHTGLMSIAAKDRLATQNMLYVLLSRATDDQIAFVDDKEELIKNLRQEMKGSSLEEQRELLLGLTEQLKMAADKESAAADVSGLEPPKERSQDLQRRAENDSQAMDNVMSLQSQQQAQQQQGPVLEM